MTLAEKLIARAAGRAAVRPGEIHTCRVDLAMMHDSSGPRRQQPKLERIGAPVWDPSRVVIVTDHFVTESDPESRAIQDLTRRWVAANGIERFHDGEGICHVVLPERGHLRPGMLAVGGDSHSTTGGAFGCLMVGIGATEMAGVLATGEIWLRVPETLRVEIGGRLGEGVAAKDLMLALCAELGLDGASYMAVEYGGEAVAAMPVDERMVLANMSAELGAKAALVAPDERTCAWLAARGVEVTDAARWQPDPAARYARTLTLDAGALVPQVAAPFSPANAAPVGEHAGTPIGRAFIGACTGAKLADLRMAARVLAGRRVAPGVRLHVAPASARIAAAAAAEGTLATLTEAGAELLPPACGACIGVGPAVLGPGEVGISSSSRNFRARMGHRDSRTYLASPYTVAAAALRGRISDPREVL